MRIHGLFFSTLILTAAISSARAQSLTSPKPLFPKDTTTAAATDPLARNYLVPHDSRNEIPSIHPAAPASKQLFITPTLHFGRPASPLLIARIDTVCYTMRSYNFPIEKSADMTRPTSSTTCEAPKDGALRRSTGLILR